MKKNASRLRLKAFFFIYYDQVLNNLYKINVGRMLDTNKKLFLNTLRILLK